MALHISIPLQFHCVFLLCQSPITINQSWVAANCYHMTEWVHWVRAETGIGVRQVTLRKSLHVSYTCVQNWILSFLTKPIIGSHQGKMAIDNASLVLSMSYSTPSNSLCNHVIPANDVSPAENVKINSCQCFPRLYKCGYGIHVIWVVTYRDQRHGTTGLNKIFIFVQGLDFE